MFKKLVVVLICFLFAFIGVLSGCSKSSDERIYQTTENLVSQGSSVVMDENSMEQEVVVYVCGRVRNPGVYTLTEGDRVYHAIEAAGGFCKNAAVDDWNLADRLTDGQKIDVFSKKQARRKRKKEKQQSQMTPGTVNLNNASKEELMTLPGIGESKADSILAYRTEHGLFSSVEDIMKISGIKEGVFHQIKDKIAVG
ncbi:MAG: helix-hairpin-helix domain-containing protein [Lachnospiraceae bacterium]